MSVIHISEPFGVPPVVVGPDIRPRLLAPLEKVLLNMHQEPQGLQVLQALDSDRSVLIHDEDYQSAEAVENANEFTIAGEP